MSDSANNPIPPATSGVETEARGYDALYGLFDSPLMRQLRLEAYGEDIGQHSWVTASELRADIARLGLSDSSHLLDLGCGPCGPLSFMMAAVGCHGTGTELSAPALVVGRTRAISLGLQDSLVLVEADLNEALPFADESFDAAMSLDVVLHLRDRAGLFQEVARTLRPKGRFLFTDAGVITGAISSKEIEQRSAHGYTQFAAPGFNEQMLERAGLRLLETEDRTSSVLKNAMGRFKARLAHRAELKGVEGTTAFEHQQHYLETVIGLCDRGALSRVMYLAEPRVL